MISKFDNINFPMFGFKNKPYEVKLDLNTIKIRKDPLGHLQTLDDKRFEGVYFERLLQLNTRAMFELTCRNIQDCLLTDIAWGIDSNGYICDLTNKEKVPQKVLPIVKVKKQYIWLKNISYPFKVNTNDILDIKDTIYAELVHIKNEWYIRKFLEDKIEVKGYCYI